VAIVGKTFKRPVRLTSTQGQLAVLDQLLIVKSSNLRIQRVKVLPRRPLPKWSAAVEIRDSTHIVLDRLDISTAKSTKGWSAKTWRTKARSGIRVSGRHVTITNNVVRNIVHGIVSRADHTKVENNLVEVFSGDGLRGLGNNSIYRGNTIKTCVKVDDNHDDGFQSWSVGSSGKRGSGVVKNVTLDRNIIVNGTHPLTCSLQGIAMFDGFYQNWTISNNLVMVDTWNGINVSGAKKVTITGNTVVDTRPGRPGAPWIRIGPHKDGQASKNSKITNNITHRVETRKSLSVQGVRRSGNRVASSAKHALEMHKQ
jgi:hypothetical protein